MLTFPHVLHEHAELGVGDPAASKVLPAARLILREESIKLGHNATPRQPDEGLLDEVVSAEKGLDSSLPVLLELRVGVCSGAGFGYPEELPCFGRLVRLCCMMGVC